MASFYFYLLQPLKRDLNCGLTLIKLNNIMSCWVKFIGLAWIFIPSRAIGNKNRSWLLLLFFSQLWAIGDFWATFSQRNSWGNDICCWNSSAVWKTPSLTKHTVFKHNLVVDSMLLICVTSFSKTSWPTGCWLLWQWQHRQNKFRNWGSILTKIKFQNWFKDILKKYILGSF